MELVKINAYYRLTPFVVLLVLLNVMACHSFMHLPDVTRGTWKNFDDVTKSFVPCCNFPSHQELKELFPTIERYVTLFYDQSSLLESINDCRKELFATKVRSLEAVPPAHDALLQQEKCAIYEASCWRQSLIAQQNLPDPNAWSWHQEENGGFSIKWITIPQASAVCRELIYSWCNLEKGCKGR